MITRLQFTVSLLDGTQADASWGYWLYSALLEQMPVEAAEWFHEQSFTPLSQYWLVDKPAHRTCWRVSLLGDEAESLLLAPLEALSRLNLRECAQPLAVSLEGRERYASLSEFWNRAAAMPDVPSHQLRIWTPASFKSGGRYVIFPEARLILQNLVLRWNAIAPQCAISANLAAKPPARTADGNLETAFAVCRFCWDRHQDRARHGRRNARAKKCGTGVKSWPRHTFFCAAAILVVQSLAAS